MLSNCEDATGSDQPIIQPSIIYEIEQGPGSKPKNGRQPLPWWCDYFGPYELLESEDATGKSGNEAEIDSETFHGTVIRGVGAFTLVSVFDHGGGRFMSQCLWGTRAAYIKQLPKPCPVRLEHHRDGTVLTRQGVHNHAPEEEAPSPLTSGRMPPLPEIAPTFDELYATLQPFKKQCKREFKTYITVLDSDTQQLVQMPITTENVRKVFDSAHQVKVDGKLRWCCPVDDCGSQMLGKWNLFRHLQIYHLPEGQRILTEQVKTTSKVSGLSIVCPICKENFKWRRKCLQHIIDHHQIPLTVSEHEFSSSADFWDWKSRTEIEEMSTFGRHKQSKLHEIEGIYQCFLGRRAAFERKCEGEAKPRKRARLLNHFCPAVMDVKLVRRSGDKSDNGGRIHVTFYRTHIGHTPSPLDVKMTDEDSLWLREQLEAGKNPQEIMADVARTFDGRGPLRRLHVLDLGDIARTAFRYGLRKPEIRRAYEWWRTVDFSRDLNLARRRLVEVIRAKLDREEHPVVKRTEKHQWAEKRIKQVLELNGVFHVREGNEIHVVYPRHASHESCEDICSLCNVCAHRYACTCISHVIDGQMCQHIHAVGLRKGAPGTEFISSLQIDPEERFNPEREIRALGRINYNQRVQEILTTLLPRMTQALKGEHFVDLERVAQLIESAVEVLEASGPVPNIHVEENVPKPLALDEFRGFVEKIRSIAGDDDSVADIADKGDLVNKGVQVGPADIEKAYADLHEEETYFERLMLSISKKNSRCSSGNGPKQKTTPDKKTKVAESSAKTTSKTPAKSAQKRGPGRPRKLSLPIEEVNISSVTPSRRSSRILERHTLSAKKGVSLSSKRKKTIIPRMANITITNCTSSKRRGRRPLAFSSPKEAVEVKVEEESLSSVPNIVVLPYQDDSGNTRKRRNKSDRGEPETVHEFVITQAPKRTRTDDGTDDPSCHTDTSPMQTVVIEVSPADPPTSTSSKTSPKPTNTATSQDSSAVEGWIHDHIYL